MAEVVAAELVMDARAVLGEGPVWDPGSESLLWVDIERHLVHVTRPSRGDDYTFDVGRPVGSVALRKRGGLVLAVLDGFAALDLDTGAVELLAAVEADVTTNRMNDGRCDPAGRFWAGTMAFDTSPGKGSLYRLDVDHRVTRVLEGVTISNGLAWTSDDSTVFYIDTPTGRVDAFDFEVDTGTLSRRRPFVEIEAGAGSPDGMTIDTDDCLWVALWGGGAVRRYTPQGDLDVIVEVPATHVTSCTFGGPSFEDLFITTATTELSAEALSEQPHAGGLFRCRPGAGGLPPVAYLG